MKQKDIIALSLQEIKDKIVETRNSLVKMKLNHKISPLENPIKIKENRKLIARLNTELTKKTTVVK